MARREILEHRVPPVCDFCLRPEVAWSYPCASFEIVEASYGSVGDWAACASCSALIEAEDYVGLLERTKAQQAPVPRFMREEVWSKVGELHSRFRENRRGPRECYEPRPDDGLTYREQEARRES